MKNFVIIILVILLALVVGVASTTLFFSSQENQTIADLEERILELESEDNEQPKGQTQNSNNETVNNNKENCLVEYISQEIEPVSFTYDSCFWDMEEVDNTTENISSGSHFIVNLNNSSSTLQISMELNGLQNGNFTYGCLSNPIVEFEDFYRIGYMKETNDSYFNAHTPWRLDEENLKFFYTPKIDSRSDALEKFPAYLEEDDEYCLSFSHMFNRQNPNVDYETENLVPPPGNFVYIGLLSSDGELSEEQISKADEVVSTLEM